MSYTSLQNIEDWNEVVERSHQKPVLVFKHSTRCNISADAHAAWERWMESAKGESVDTALVRVVEERPVSNAIEEQLGVKHASPQAILIKNGKAEWHTSHWHITEASLAENVR
ncbi:bacillithiol system redox-active protein YtxJ [Paenibacillus pasadenensis]|uniref:bacillithiol system redox-active protein YtxJ n=1 Tax=Paenibacillus pasadenensis TaxID=217090 RepID=UPI002040548B|nr:bacillithiol system redox-active protein YtxJ [Paenibacillus pasadenensis]MCM3746192.1 bacillithiol system redox-active protein YtxJ [Paenibacillus pasadenensis]